MFLVRLVAKITLENGKEVSCETEEHVIAEMDDKAFLEYLLAPPPLDCDSEINGKEIKAS